MTGRLRREQRNGRPGASLGEEAGGLRERFSIRPRPGTIPEQVLSACDQQTLNLVASFQRAMVNDLVSKTLAAAREHNVATLLVTGGVAANTELRSRFESQGAAEGLPVFFPSRKLATDNAAMIAAAAYARVLSQEFADAELSADAGLKLR